MKKEERNAIRVWCKNVTDLRNAEIEVQKLAPEGIETLMEFPHDRDYPIAAGIEKLACVMRVVLHIDTFSNKMYQKWMIHNGIRFFQLENYSEEADR